MSRQGDPHGTGAVVGLPGVGTVDSFPGRVPAGAAARTGVPAVRTAVAGMRPAAAVTPVEPGLTPPAPAALSTGAPPDLLARPLVPRRDGGHGRRP